MQYIPLFDRILIKPISSEQNFGGLIIPDSSSNLKKGIAVSVGGGKNGMPMTVEQGQTVLFRPDDATPITLDGEQYLILTEGNTWLYGVEKP